MKRTHGIGRKTSNVPPASALSAADRPHACADIFPASGLSAADRALTSADVPLASALSATRVEHF